MSIGIIYTFIKRNPFYIYFLYGNVLSGSFYSIPGLFLIPASNFSLGIIDYIIFIITIPELFYLIILFKNADYAFEGMFRASYDPNIQYLLIDPEAQERYEQQLYEAQEREKKIKKEHNKQFKRDWIITICLICMIGFYLSIFI